jgi:hypothetical protein
MITLHTSAPRGLLQPILSNWSAHPRKIGIRLILEFPVIYDPIRRNLVDSAQLQLGSLKDYADPMHGGVVTDWRGPARSG